MSKCMQISVVAISAWSSQAVYQNDDMMRHEPLPEPEGKADTSFGIGDIFGALPFAGGKGSCGLFSCDGGLDLDDFDEYLKAEQKNDSAAPASDSREEF